MTDDKTRCESDAHEQHLCWIAAQAVKPEDSAHRPSTDELEALARDPRFRCDLCGRVAGRARNLCRPVRLSENGACGSAAHGEHLCHMVAQALCRNEPLVYYGGWSLPQGREALARNPRFRCRACGRLARNEENLCDPMEIASS